MTMHKYINTLKGKPEPIGKRMKIDSATPEIIIINSIWKSMKSRRFQNQNIWHS